MEHVASVFWGNSRVIGGDMVGKSTAAIEVKCIKAKDTGMGKCPRCWRWYPSIAYDISRGVKEGLEVCNRCKETLECDWPNEECTKAVVAEYRRVYNVDKKVG